MAIIAQLSDIHLAAGRDGTVDDGSGPVRALRAAVSSLLSLPARPDAVVLTGDLADAGLPAEYARLHALLSPLPMPVYPLAGNHDVVDALRAAFDERPAVVASGSRPGAPLQYTADVAGVRLVCCDTSVQGGASGCMDDERLEWLDAVLAEAPEKPTVVATHHPPYPIGIRFIDAMRFENHDVFAKIVSGHPQVVRVMSGNVHRGSAGSFGGVVCTTCPSTYRQLFLDLTQPGHAAVTGEPAGFAVHLVTTDPPGTATTHFVPTGSYRPLMDVE
ncbi:3',5'-cyclic adenosine monophosphate phosphodiesterase CpdA [Actinomadura rubteroloni]|uniref:3',5'-cyclic adenosine monophosphate phosphodiesterase CpdA n=1 Tax=Actinomadura rubteroloni TaxID=1926885 RepID=A0A2P4UJY2_9ACTN|nr:phosphodiesterase [Actinomadura rubteroloni]POM25367.1 3',5'-cyclic adenosine monophosphate phosphodiesterase CpdA [Actinomadura rubteroloni]